MSDSALIVHLHPLTLIQISDQIIRAKCEGRSQRVIGALIGAQEGRRVDIHNSFELCGPEEAVSDETANALDLEYFKMRLGQYAEVFPKYEFLGWYSAGLEPLESDFKLHKKFMEASDNENPFLLLLDTKCTDAADQRSDREDLPVKVYDSVTHIVNQETVHSWNPVPFEIDTLEAERIALDHVAKTATKTSVEHSSDFTQHVDGLGNSLVMLNHRVKDLLQYLHDVKAGKVAKNHEVLRQLLSVCEALRSNHPEALHRQFYGEFNDALLVVHLSTLTKTCANISDLIDKFQLAHDKKHRHRHHYPFG